MDLITRVKAIDRAALTPIVRRSLKSAAFEIDDWGYRPLLGGAGDLGSGASGIYRFAGDGHEGGERRSWSLVLKTVSSALGGSDVSDWDFWKRELLAYKSGYLNALPGGLAAPRCFGLEQGADWYWLWLEEITDESETKWPLERFAQAARHLGQFNGAYLAGQPLPSYPWLSTGWLRRLMPYAAPAIGRLREPLLDPLQRPFLPADVVAGLLRLWDEREHLIAAVERLPQTVCHRDAFRRNLFVRRGADGRAQTVAIDWAFAGIGAVGEELAALFAGSLAFDEVEMDQARELEQCVLEGYLDGLRAAGWPVEAREAREARLGFYAASPLIYSIGYLMIPDKPLEVGQREDNAASMERPSEEDVDGWARYMRIMLAQAEAARQLIEG